MVTTGPRTRKIDVSVDEIRNSLPVAADTKINEGAYVAFDSTDGVALPLAFQADRLFAGVAVREADNTGGAAGDVRVIVRSQFVEELPLPGGFTEGDFGAAVYLTDDDDAVTKSNTSSVEAGKVLAADETRGVLRVAFKSAAVS